MRVQWHNIGSKYSSVGLTQAKKYLLKVCFATNEFFHTGRWEEQFLSECINLSKCQKNTNSSLQVHLLCVNFTCFNSFHKLSHLSGILQLQCNSDGLKKKRDLPYTTSGSDSMSPIKALFFTSNESWHLKHFTPFLFPWLKKIILQLEQKRKKHLNLQKRSS